MDGDRVNSDFVSAPEKAPGTFTSLLYLREGEALTAFMLLALSAFHGFALAFLFTAANALFLSRYSIEYLPYVYIVSSGVVIIAGLLYSRYQNRLAVARFFPRVLVFSCVSLVLFCAGLWRYPEYLLWYFGLMVLDKLIQTLVSLEFSGVSSLLLDLRQGKRLFGLVSAGEVAASIVGYVLSPVIVSYLGVNALVGFAAVSFAFGGIALAYILRRHKARFAAMERMSGSHEQKSPFAQISRLSKNKYVLAICLLTAFSVCAFHSIDFGFLRQAQMQSPDATQLVFYFGIFFAAGDALNLLIRIFLSGRIIDKFGIRTGLLILPASLFAVTAIALVYGMFPMGAMNAAWLLILFIGVSRMFDAVLRTSLQDSSYFILFQPMKAKERLSARTLAEGVVEPLAVGATGALILLLSRFGLFDVAHLDVFLLLILAGWILTAMFLGKEYARSLMRAMKGRLFDGNAVMLNDAASREVVRMKIDSPRPEEAIYALDLLEKSHSHTLPVYLAAMLQRSSEVVRLNALERIARLKISDALPQLLVSMQSNDSSRIRASAILAYCSILEERAVETVAPYLDDSAPAIRSGAITGLLRYGGIDGVLLAANYLMDLSRSVEAERRVRAAEIIGDVGSFSFYRLVRDLAGDDDVEVRKAALRTAAKIKNAKMIPIMIDALAFPQTQSIAVAALVAVGSPALTYLEAAIADPNRRDNRHGALARMIRVIGRIRGYDAIAFLKEHIEYPDEAVRNQALASLSYCGYRAEGAGDERVKNAMRNEISYAYWYLATLAQLESEPKMNLLRQALEIEMDQIRERVFYLLSFLYDAKDAKTVLRARDNLRLHSSEHRAFALESLDMQMPGEIKRMFFPLIESLSLRERIARLAPYFSESNVEPDMKERLRNIIAGPESHFNSWSKACSIQAVALLELDDLLDDVVAAFGKTGSAYVRESAAHAVRALAPERLPVLRESVSLFGLPDAAANALNKFLYVPDIHDSRNTPMLLTIEKVIILKTVEMFSETPDDVLVEVASILEEEEFASGDLIIRKGDAGNCMYIIREGSVRVHDGTVAIAELRARDIFGEFSLLDTETRSASVTALEPTYTLRIDQDAFYEIMTDRIEVGKGIIRVLTKRLRKQNQLLAQLPPKSE